MTLPCKCARTRPYEQQFDNSGGDVLRWVYEAWTHKSIPESTGGVHRFRRGITGANTQGETLEETRANLEEAIELVLEANRAMAEEQLMGQDVIRESIALSAA
jgi:hypothetical protein